jgi:hypothetical protein
LGIRACEDGTEGVFPEPIDFPALKAEINCRFAERGVLE